MTAVHLLFDVELVETADQREGSLNDLVVELVDLLCVLLYAYFFRIVTNLNQDC